MNMVLFNTLRSTNLRIAIIIFTSLYIALLLALQYNRPHYPETIDLLPQIDEQTKRLASQVQVGLYVKKFPEFSFTNKLFSMDAIIWFRFPQSTETLDTIEKFNIQNSELLPSQELVYKSPPDIKIIGKEVLISYHILVKFRTEQLFKQFPLGGHRLIFTLENKSITSRELCFITTSENLVLAETLHSTWQAQQTFAQAGYITSPLKPNDAPMKIDYPAVTFAIDFKSVGGRDLFSLYFPLFVIFFISLLGLVIDIFNFAGITIVATSLPLLVLFRLVIQGASPDITYTSHIDFTFYTLVLLSMLIFFIQAYICLENQNIKEHEDTALKKNKVIFLENLSNVLFFIIPFLLMMIMTYGFLR